MRTLHPNRREIILAGAAGGLTIAAPLNYAAIARAKRLPKATHGTFAHGVSAGFPHPDSMILWTRVSEIGRSATVELEVAKDKHFKHVVHRAQVARRRHARLHRARPCHRAEAGDEYFYRFATTSTHSRVGRFRTAPPKDSKQPLKIGFYSCSELRGRVLQCARRARERGPRPRPLPRRLHLRAPLLRRARRAPGPHREEQGRGRPDPRRVPAEVPASTRRPAPPGDARRVSVRLRVGRPRGRGQLRRVAAGLEAAEPAFENNGKTRRRVPFGQRRKNGYQAFFESMPRIRPKGSHKNQIYGAVQLGGLVDLFLTDQRQYRTPRRARTSSSRRAPTTRTRRTRSWARRRSSGSSAQSPRRRRRGSCGAARSMIMSLDVSPGNHVNPDQWDGYSAEREEILGTSSTGR